MIRINFTVERKINLSEADKKLLSEIYGALWTEGFHDPDTQETMKFARPLAEKMQTLNKRLKFRL